MEMMNVKTFVLCRDAGGSPDFFVTDVCLPRSGYDLGHHFDVAKKRAEESGYESPMEPFDEFEPAGKALASMFAKKPGDGDIGEIPAILVWLGEGGVEEVIADFPLRYVVVTTDTEYAEEDCLFEINTGKETHEVLCHTGVGTVNQHEAGFVWNQVRRLAEPDLWQPVDYSDLDALPAELSHALRPDGGFVQFVERVSGLGIWDYDKDDGTRYKECEEPSEGFLDSHCCLMGIIEEARKLMSQ